MTILPVSHHSDNEVGPIVFILDKNIANYKDMPWGRSAEIKKFKMAPRGILRLIFTVQMTHLPFHHHGDYRI